MKNDFPQFLKERRISLNLSIQALAKASGISASHISRMERGQRNPSVETLKKLSPLLQVDYEELLKIAHLTDKNITLHLEQVLSSKHLFYNNKPVDEETREKIKEILKLNA